jgi:hypothetical protein
MSRDILKARRRSHQYIKATSGDGAGRAILQFDESNPSEVF